MSTTSTDITQFVKNSWNSEEYASTIKLIKNAYENRENTAMENLILRLWETVKGPFTGPIELIKAAVKAIREWLS